MPIYNRFWLNPQTNQPNPSLLTDLGPALAVEISVIQALAGRLLGILQVRDPLSEPVHLSRATAFATAANGAARADRWPRLAGSYHGSGCTLASAIAAQLALGLDLSAAVQAAQDYTWRALEAAFRPGSGQWIPDRLYALRGVAR